MGRRVFGRTALAVYLVVPAAFGLAGDSDLPLAPAQSPAVRNASNSVYFLPPRQGHAAPKAWNGDLGWVIANRKEIDYWIMEWASPSGIKRLTDAADRVFDYRRPVDAIIRAEGIPWEMASIPMVESNWRTTAVSSSGAVGPWQFLESTGRGRGLAIDSWRDERRDIWKSTRAATAELNFHYRLFGDWSMAIGSYNAGPTRMRRIKESGGYSGYWDMYDAGVLPRETKKYVPQVIAVAYVLSHAGRLGLPVKWEEPPQWTTIPVNRSIHLGTLSAVVDLDRELIRKTHGELNHPVTPPPSLPYMLKVPSEDEDAVRDGLLELMRTGSPERFWRYTVRSGDTLSEISRKYEITLNELMRYNDHVAESPLRVGERIYLPGDNEEPPGVDAEALPEWKGRYRVQPGDSLWSIAKYFEVPPEILADVNHRSINGVLDAGSMLRVPKDEEEL